ncbi:hypothetical protein [Amycolatopsis speibonae]|uniref:PE domain-containing protein n=1 Tax=Amycolatopsis speibonae TaxID=1450224 RepID=A0ABV7NU25_9PSEU
MTDGTGEPPGGFSQMLGDFSAQADAMVTAAKEGKFKVSEEAGEALKKAINDYVFDWNSNKRWFQRLAEKPKLGTGPYAQRIGDHAVLVADGDDLSAKKQLDMLRDIVLRANEAIDLAKTKYKQQDEHGVDAFKNLKQG